MFDGQPKMLSRSRRTIGLAVLLVVLIAGAVTAAIPPDPETHLVTLPSGRTIEVIQMGQDDAESWSLTYRTRLPMNDQSRLACEVEGIWKELVAQVDKAGTRKAVISPENFSIHLAFAGWRPVIFSHMSTGYIFKKDDAGKWAPPRSGPPPCRE